MKTVFYCDPFVPPEWIAAHGLGPERAIPAATSDKHGMPGMLGVCPYAMAFAHASAHSDAAAVVFATTCDQMRRICDIVTEDYRIARFLINVPSVWQRPAGIEMYISELRRLGEFLVRLGGERPSDGRLAQVMSDFQQRRSESRERAAVGKDAIPVALLAGHMMKPSLALFQIVAEHGGQVVLDATGTGERTVPAAFDRDRLEHSPLEELAHAYFGTIPDVFRRPNNGLYEWLEAAIAERGVRGLVLCTYVWCDKWRVELETLRQRLQVPVLAVDAGDGDNAGENRIRTQVQAFMEMIR
jgi:benzoyl-CoA reductase/2-hydroxyglutaryl-CoA dehydratase subunit BcrC/BadD/HgdB